MIGVVSGGGSNIAVVGLAVEAAVVVELISGGSSRAGHRGSEGKTLNSTRALRKVIGEGSILEAEVVPELKVGLEGGDSVGALALNLQHESRRLETITKGERQRAGHVDGGGEADGTAGRERQVEELSGGVGAEKLFLHCGDEEGIDRAEWLVVVRMTRDMVVTEMVERGERGVNKT